MTFSPSTAEIPRSLCALEGCETPIVRSPSGGRPRLYCSDAHRALARRRRLTARGGEPEEGLAGAASLLEEALERLQRAAAPPPARPDPAVAAERARATAEVLEAQQAAALAARHAAESDRRLALERRAWEDARAAWDATRVARDEAAARDAAILGELRDAVDGAQRALKDELLRHHADLAAAEERLVTEAARHDALRRALDASRQALADTSARASAEATRAERAEDAAAGAARTVVELTDRLARAQTDARHAERRAADLAAMLRRDGVPGVAGRRGGRRADFRGMRPVSGRR